MTEPDDSLSKAVLIAIVLGVLFTVVFTLFVLEKNKQDDAFTELYFTQPDALPDIMQLNHTYNVSFTFTNHELEPTEYVYSVESVFENFSRIVTLGVGESASFTLSVTPRERVWDVEWDVISHSELTYDKAALNTISYNLSTFGEILHVNTTLDELPLSYDLVNDTVSGNVSTSQTINTTLSYDGSHIIQSDYEHSVYHILARKPFFIRLYSPGEQLKIYFFHEIK